MASEAIPASSKYWDNKRIELTDNTKKNIIKKGYLLDAETMFQQYKLEGQNAVEAARQNQISEEQLAADPRTFSYLGSSAITDLEANASKESRVNAIVNLTKLGFTNLYENTTRNFILPPDEPEEEKSTEEQAPAEQPPQEEQSRYQYVRSMRPAPVQEQPQPPQEQPQEEQSIGVIAAPVLAGASKFVMNIRRGPAPRNPNTMTPARMSPQPMRQEQAQTVQQQRQTMQRQSPVQQARQMPMQRAQPTAPPAPRPLLNAGMAAKLGGRMASPVQPARQISQGQLGVKPKAKFGFKR